MHADNPKPVFKRFTALFAPLVALFKNPEKSGADKIIAADDFRKFQKVIGSDGARRFARNIGQQRKRRRKQLKLLRSL